MLHAIAALGLSVPSVGRLVLRFRASGRGCAHVGSAISDQMVCAQSRAFARVVRSRVRGLRPPFRMSASRSSPATLLAFYDTTRNFDKSFTAS